MVRGVVVAGVLLMVLAACGQPAPDQPVAVGPTTGSGGGAAGIEPVSDDGMLRRAARDLLGVAEEDLPSGVRVARRGDEHMVLTEDYVLGRMTVELDARDGGKFRVVAVTVEMKDGPRTFRE